MFDVLIRNGTLVDGSGGPRVTGDVGIGGERILAVGALGDAVAARVIDAGGRIVAPGFIDPHSHSDFTLLTNPEFQSTVRQGVTTEIVGNCGLGVAPVSDAAAASVARRLEEFGYGCHVTWRTAAQYLATIQEARTSANVAWLVGHNAVRLAAGVAGDVVSAGQAAAMRAFVAEAMDAGALGISTGLEFEPGRLASRDEVLDLVTVAGRSDGIHASHIRNRDARLQDAVDEFLSVTRDGGARGQVSHLNVRHHTGAADGAWERAVATVEGARGAGMDVLADATPMTSGDGVAAALLPAWLMAEGPAVAAARLGDPSVRARAREDSDRYWRFIHRGEWERVRLLSSAEFPELCGLTFPEIATTLRTDPWNAFFDILAAAGENLEAVSLVAELFTEAHSAATIGHPLFLIGADTMTSTVDGPLSAQTRHPLHFAAHAHVLAHHVRDAGTLPLEEAVRKMTSMVADRFGLGGRGRIVAGGFADLAIFDLDAIAEVSTIGQPLAYATGVSHVLVNGTIVIDEGRHTGARPGRVLRRA